MRPKWTRYVAMGSIFSHAHVARENDLNSLPPAGGKLCEAFLTRCISLVAEATKLWYYYKYTEQKRTERRAICI